jgi:3',5'-cyclic AMP phosphodiesterase CpdA
VLFSAKFAREPLGYPLRVTAAGVFVMAQISDVHLRVRGDGGTSARALEAAVRSIAALDPAPHALLLSGDLADTGSAEEYRRARELLAPLSMPIHVAAGNHDDRAGLREHFAAPASDGLVQYAVDHGPLRLVVCDTMQPGRGEGSYGPERIRWLEAALDGDRETPTIVAMHHPPLLTGIGVVDELGLPAADQRAIGAVIGRHPQVGRIVAGHVHRSFAGALAGCAVSVCQSTTFQLHLGAALAGRIVLTREPAGFALHIVHGGEVTSHTQPIGDHPLID